jgi:hypothetical protein
METGMLLSFASFFAESLTVLSAVVIYVLAKRAAKNASVTLKVTFSLTVVFAGLGLLFPVPYLISVPAAFDFVSAMYVITVLLLVAIHVVLLNLAKRDARKMDTLKVSA